MSHRMTHRINAPDENHLFRRNNGGAKRDDSPLLPPVARRVGPTHLRRIADSLLEVDRAVVEVLALVRIASGKQLNQLLWPVTSAGARQAQRRLQRLVELRVLTRLPRQVGGVRGGSQGATFALDVVGQRLARANQTGSIRRPAPSDYFVDHTLAITDVYVALRTSGIELVGFEPEPDCWRNFTGPAGRPLTLRPDAYAAWATDDWELTAFFEVDRATEHPGRVTRKCEQYIRYWRTGDEQRHDDVFPAVVWVTPNERRTELLRGVIGELDSAAHALFVVITQGELGTFITNATREEAHP